jgi:hypothetical protein
MTTTSGRRPFIGQCRIINMGCSIVLGTRVRNFNRRTRRLGANGND